MLCDLLACAIRSHGRADVAALERTVMEIPARWARLSKRYITTAAQRRQIERNWRKFSRELAKKER